VSADPSPTSEAAPRRSVRVVLALVIALFAVVAIAPAALLLGGVVGFGIFLGSVLALSDLGVFGDLDLLLIGHWSGVGLLLALLMAAYAYTARVRKKGATQAAARAPIATVGVVLVGVTLLVVRLAHSAKPLTVVRRRVARVRRRAADEVT